MSYGHDIYLGDALVRVSVEGERIIMERKVSSVAVKGRGLFKVKGHVEDVDVAIREGSLITAAKELRNASSR